MKRDNVKPIRPRTEDWNNLSTQKRIKKLLLILLFLYMVLLMILCGVFIVY